MGVSALDTPNGFGATTVLAVDFHSSLTVPRGAAKS
jgi:hypothetical protein